jgi:alcohol dehydrogenase (cytochrome c)
LVFGLIPATLSAQEAAKKAVDQATKDMPAQAGTQGPPAGTQGPSPSLAPEASQRLANYQPVTDQRLLKPEPGNWLMYRATYNGWGYSPLDKINTQNVKKLQPVWSFSTGVNEGHQAPPIVNNGVMFVTTPQAQVIALDAVSGEQLWRYKRQLPDDLFQLHPTNRGVALYGDRVYVTTVDCFLVALDAKTGKVVWEAPVDDYKKGYYMTLAPLIAKGKVMVGVSGGEYGIRGYVSAYDANDGKQAWRTYTIPGPGEPGHETWQGDDWKNGGGSVWLTGHYDPETNLSYWGTGNAAPWPGEAHPGDNLYTTSVIALDVDTGKLKGHHQYHWNDSWDWDEVSTPLLVDVERNGRTIKGLVHPARNGYLWVLERTADKIFFVDAKPYVYQNAFKSIDPKTGRPDYDPQFKPGFGKKVDFCPSLWGGKDWPPAAYNPQTKLLYIPANENLCGSLTGRKEQYTPGQLYLGTAIEDIGMTIRPGADHIGEIQAWDLAKMQKVWTHKYPKSHNWGPILTTAGGLVFAGGSNDRYFRAFDAKTGEVLWQQRTNSGVTAVPVAYEVDGKQYVAVQSGWGVDAQRKQEKLDGLLGTALNVPQGGVLWVFAVQE